MNTYRISVQNKMMAGLPNIRLVESSYGEDTLEFLFDQYFDPSIYTWYITYRLSDGSGSVDLLTDVGTVQQEDRNLTRVDWTVTAGVLSHSGPLEIQLTAISNGQEVTTRYTTSIGVVYIAKTIESNRLLPIDGTDVFADWMNRYQSLYDQIQNEKGAPGGIASLDENGYLNEAQYSPRFNEVWEVYIRPDSIEYSKDWLSELSGGDSLEPSPARIYIVKSAGVYLDHLYAWNSTQNRFVLVGSGLVLGESSGDAYRGDRGKIAYEHTLSTQNPHAVTKAQVGLSEADNTADRDKNVLSATRFTTGRKVSVGTAVVSTPTVLDGTSDIEIPVSSVKAEYVHGDLDLDSIRTDRATTDLLVPETAEGTLGQESNRYKNIYAGRVDSTNIESDSIDSNQATIDTLTSNRIDSSFISGSLQGNASSADKVNHVLELTRDSVTPTGTYDGSQAVQVYSPDQKVNSTSSPTFVQVTALLDGDVKGGSSGALVYQEGQSSTTFLSVPDDVSTLAENTRYILSTTESGPRWIAVSTPDESEEIVSSIFD